MITFDLNYWAILGAAVSSMILGALWYSPLAFGKLWMKLIEVTDHEMEKAKEKGMLLNYFAMFLLEFAKAFVLAHFVNFVGALTWDDGLTLGFLVWLGFVGTITMNPFIWGVKKKPFALYFIDNGYLALSLIVQAIILTLWI